jgi:Ser-tRNA(Ala) deacylase AlaX
MSKDLKQVLDEQIAKIEGKPIRGQVKIIPKKVKKILAAEEEKDKKDKKDKKDEDEEGEEIREDKHMVSLKSSHYKKAVQMLKQLGVPEQAGELRIMVILGIAAQLARGDGMQALQAIKAIKTLMTSFLTKGQERLDKNAQYQNFLTDHKLFASLSTEAKAIKRIAAKIKASVN